jgi:hypothetical protein
MTFLQNLRFGLTLGIGFALGERFMTALMPWLTKVVEWVLSGQ